MMHMHYRSGVDATMATRVVIGSKAKKTFSPVNSPLLTALAMHTGR